MSARSRKSMGRSRGKSKEEAVDESEFEGQWWLDEDRASRYPIAAHKAKMRYDRLEAKRKAEQAEETEARERAKRESHRLQNTFKLFDVDGSGTISKDEISRVLKKMKVKASQKQIDVAMKEVDESKDGEIDFNEFEDFVRSLKTQTGGFSIIFQKYMSQFKTTEGVEESVKEFLDYLCLGNAKDLKKRMNRSGKHVQIGDRELIHAKKEKADALLRLHSESAEREGTALSEDERRHMFIFLAYASPGDAVNPGYMSVFQWAKYVKDLELKVEKDSAIYQKVLGIYEIETKANKTGVFSLREWQHANGLIAKILDPRSYRGNKTETIHRFMEDYVFANAKAIKPDPLAEELQTPEVQELINRARWPLFHIFQHYASVDEGEGHSSKRTEVKLEDKEGVDKIEAAAENYAVRKRVDTVISNYEFLTFLRNFNVLGDRGIRGNSADGGEGIMSLSTARKIFRSANFGLAADSDINHICFTEFLECICRCALVLYPLKDVERQIQLQGGHPIVTFSNGPCYKKLAAQIFNRKDKVAARQPKPPQGAGGSGQKRVRKRASQFRREKLAEQMMDKKKDHSVHAQLYHKRRETFLKPAEVKKKMAEKSAIMKSGGDFVVTTGRRRQRVLSDSQMIPDIPESESADQEEPALAATRPKNGAKRRRRSGNKSGRVVKVTTKLDKKEVMMLSRMRKSSKLKKSQKRLYPGRFFDVSKTSDTVEESRTVRALNLPRLKIDGKGSSTAGTARVAGDSSQTARF